MRALLLSLALLAAAPASASAALGQVEPLAVRGDLSCVAATGTPGELTLLTSAGVRFAQATKTGFALGPAIKVPEGFSCGATRTRPSGAGVIAGAAEFNRLVTVLVRDPGGTWSAPIALAVEDGWSANGVTAAVSDRGDVIVAWSEQQESKTRFRTARRAPGGVFGTPETLGAPSRRDQHLQAGIAATGEAFVLTTRMERSTSPFRIPVEVRIASAGAPFGAPARVADSRWAAMPSLAVAADGRALVAVTTRESFLVAERAPGGAFGPAIVAGDASDSLATQSWVALGDDGQAALAWSRLQAGDIQVRTRTGPGAFGTPTRVDAGSVIPRGYDGFLFTEAFYSSLVKFSGGIIGISGLADTLPLTPDGRAVANWLDLRSGMPEVALLTAPLAGGAPTLQPTGRGVGYPFTQVALVLADGTPAVAWTQGGSPLSQGERFFLHLAAEGVIEQPDPAPPRVTIGTPRSRTLDGKTPLRVPVACSGPCEVRVALDGVANDAEATVYLSRAGRATATIGGAVYAVGRELERVKLLVSSRAPGAKHAQLRTTSVRLRSTTRGRTIVTGLRAERHGGSIRVSWSVTGNRSGAASINNQILTATKTRDASEEPVAVRVVSAMRREFSVTLRAAEARYVTVRTLEFLSGERRKIVRIR